jgi:hypothetical protein
MLGLVLGAFIAAKMAGEFKLRVPKEPKTLLFQWIGGIAMGVGGAFAQGCNVGNFLRGVGLLSVGSIVTTVSIIAGCWLGTWLVFMRGED